MDPFILHDDLAWRLPDIKTFVSPCSIVAGISTRNHGVSTSPFTSLNMGFHVKDSLEAVRENRNRLGRVLSFPTNSWIGAEQIHKDHIERVSTIHKGRGAMEYADSLPGTDGIYTTDKELLLIMNYADCVPLYFYSQTKEAVGIAHAGWRGTVMKIGSKMIKEWGNELSAVPNDIHVLIGPSIGQCCYEVDESVMTEVRRVLPNSNRSVAENTKEGKYQLDLKELNRLLLLESGVPASNIQTSEMCTSCSNDLFFSHRKEQGKTGRMLGFIGMKR